VILKAREALQEAHQTAAGQSNCRSIEIGEVDPNDVSWMVLCSGKDYLRRHLQAAAQRLEREGRIELTGVDIGRPVHDLYQRSVWISHLAELASALYEDLALQLRAS
jgi:cobalamin biosynthesis protein CobT